MWIDKKPILALAPMADMTDSPFCRVCRGVAGNDFVVFREMVSSEAIVRNNAKTLKMCEFEKSEWPIIIQIFGSDPVVIRKAARIIVDKCNPVGIDINMGCPVPKISGKVNAGAALMRDHETAEKIIRELKNENLGVPISVKTRLGWNEEKEILEFAPKLEEAGADAITIHGRTKSQGYSGQANWEMIGEVKKRVSIPLIANGDINSQEDIKKCLEITQADGIMIGRGALGNPWVFNGSQPSLKEVGKIVLKHAQFHLDHYGENSMVTFRKHLAWYFKGDRVMVQDIKKIRAELVKINNLDDLKKILASF